MIGVERLVRLFLKRLTLRKMDRFYEEREDPYGFRTSRFDTERLKAMEATLGNDRYRRVLEIGASQGEFTERLAPRAEHLTALEISSVAGRRAQDRLAVFNHLEWVCEDVRSWEPPKADFDLIVLAEVLYYLDKPFARREFDRQFRRIVDWLAPGGRLLLTHGFLGERERLRRRGFRERFERLGLMLVAEEVVAIDPSEERIQCMVSLLVKPTA